MTSHYQVLGVRPTASAETVKRAYYRKARASHPDAHAGSAAAVLGEAERTMAALNAAWHVLRDPVLRAEYDAALAQKPRKAPPKPTAPTALIGRGFHYRFGLLGAMNRDGDERPRLSLTVDGATDLAPLRSLVPDGLWALHAQGARITDAELANLRGMRALQVLDLTGTPITDAGLLHIEALDSLETLLLWDTAVTDAGLAMLGGMSSLRILGLGNTRVTDAGLAHLAGLGHLRVLQLGGTAVEGYGLEHLHGLLDLDIVSLPWRVRGRHRRRLRAALPGTLVA